MQREKGRRQGGFESNYSRIEISAGSFTSESLYACLNRTIVGLKSILMKKGDKLYILFESNYSRIEIYFYCCYLVHACFV